MGNVLNSNELVTISILQQIKIELLTEKARLQREGRAIEEKYIEDEPQKDEYISDESVIEGTVTFEQLIEKQLNAPTPIEQLTHEAEKLNADKVETSEGEVIQMPKKAKPSILAQFNAWLIARSAWRIRKSELDYEYNRTKADVAHMCYGIDFAIGIIDREIDRQKSGRAVQVEIPKASETNIV